MFRLVSIFLSGLYVKLRGRTNTETVLTDNTMTHNHVFTNDKGQAESVLLMCHQFKHTTRMRNQFWKDLVTYTYKVEVVLIKGVDLHHRMPVSYFPHLCADWLADTTYPHMCAINAYIDQIINDESSLNA